MTTPRQKTEIRYIAAPTTDLTPWERQILTQLQKLLDGPDEDGSHP